MLKSYFKIAWRNLLSNKMYSAINIIGLATGMAVALMIGLWIWDEVSFDKDNKNYERIAQLKQNQSLNGNIATWTNMPYPIADALRNTYGSSFTHVVMGRWTTPVLSADEKKLTQAGIFMEPGAPEMLDLTMLKGNRNGLKDPYSILLNESTAKAFFGDADPMNKIIAINNREKVKVSGVYKDLPNNSSFARATFIAPWQLALVINKWILQNKNPWGSNAFQVFVELAPDMDMNTVSAKIRNVKLDNINKNERDSKPQIFLHPMSKWHLYEEFKQGINTGGRIEFVWLFGIIGIFVLLLACINFMNLSTARSEKRAKEVGVRKAVGSLRRQLVGQFLSESLVVAFLALVLAIMLVAISLPFFNTLADKKMSIPVGQPLFWICILGFTFFTGLISGSYPAFYLSGFNPVKVLKGTFRAGRFAALPRRALVVVQFTVSIVLIIGTVVVFRQVEYARNRPIGYNRSGLITIQTRNNEIQHHFDAVKTELVNSGLVKEIAQSSSPITDIWSSNGGLSWKGKNPGEPDDFPTADVSYDFGKTVGWQISAGRDFSRDFAATDSSAFILNETAVKYMGFQNPVGESISYNDGVAYKVIGVVKDMVMESPYEPVRPTLFRLTHNGGGIITLKISQQASVAQALGTIETIFKKYNPSQPFDYKFTDDDYAKKFADEERIGSLATVFAVLAIFISCLGLWGLASFVAEQRTKEIGVRKVLGASVADVWGLLSKDFAWLVFISICVATPLAYYLMHNWLQRYSYHSGISWWIFAVTGMGAITITLLTVSFQAIKAALMNPVKSLRTE